MTPKTSVLSAAITAAVVMVGGTSSFAQMPEGDATRGERVFARCKTCHAIDETRPTGPLLGTVIGRKPGTVEDFRGYSKGMIAYGEEGNVWTEENIFEYLENPQALIRGGRMAFRLPRDQDRADVIAYVKANQIGGGSEEMADSSGEAETEAPAEE